MSEAFSVERRKIIRFLGGKVILVNPAFKGTGMLIKAKQLADKHGYFWTNQFEYEANAWIHEQTTGPELVGPNGGAFGGDTKLDHFVLAYGTGGTLLGVGRSFKKLSPETKIHVCEPSNAPMLYSEIPSEYPEDGPLAAEAHPVWRPHLFQGWATDFIPKLVGQAQKELDFELIPVGGYDGIRTSQELAAKEGIFCGTSGGGIVYAALELAKKVEPGTNICAVVTDTAERYLSTPLFADIPADMTEAEKEIAASTPDHPPPAPGLPDSTPEAVAFVKEQISGHKAVVWSLEYCEFCWTLTKFLDRLGVPYERIDIDNFKFAKDQMGNKYRAALCDDTKCNTFPQFFVDGRFVGGAVDACTMWKKGELQSLLEEAGLKKNNFNDYEGDPFEVGARTPSLLYWMCRR